MDYVSLLGWSSREHNHLHSWPWSVWMLNVNLDYHMWHAWHLNIEERERAKPIHFYGVQSSIFQKTQVETQVKIRIRAFQHIWVHMFSADKPTRINIDKCVFVWVSLSCSGISYVVCTWLQWLRQLRFWTLKDAGSALWSSLLAESSSWNCWSV